MQPSDWVEFTEQVEIGEGVPAMCRRDNILAFAKCPDGTRLHLCDRGIHLMPIAQESFDVMRKRICEP